ncbi:Rho-binding antiterminator [Shewanella ulleungensis]|uniref:Rho-binding antiterminator n=1 Tax=Shewanella ulleungensis TaxID=2282699 RepID=UPI003D7946CB
MTSINCAHYDYIEIICLHQYSVKLTLHSGIEVIGNFTQTTIVQLGGIKHEAISGITQQQQPIEIILTDIQRIDVLSANAILEHLSLS